MTGSVIIFYLIVFLSLTRGNTAETSDYFCDVNDLNIKVASSRLPHSASRPSSNCSLSLCDTDSTKTCRKSSTPCFDYRTKNNHSYCAPGGLCSLLEPCDITGGCASNTSICIVNSCCVSQSICLPLSWTNLCSPPLETNNTNLTSRVYTATFHVGWFNASPDGYTRPILGINDAFLAPTIIVQKGDRINITVVNHGDEPTTIHWHGLEQRGSLIMDGVPALTQCAIPSSSSYIYTFSTENQAGTFWYHSHAAIQYGDGLKGAFIIQDPHDPWRNSYTDEDILQISDWYHTPLYILVKPFLVEDSLEPIPDTGLINNIGQYNCNKTSNCSYYRATLRPGTTKRFRIINTGVYSPITLTIDQHDMRVIEADGINLDGNKVVRSLCVIPGQRYSVLVTAKEAYRQSYWIRATLHPPVTFIAGQYGNITQPNVSAILQYGNDITADDTVIVPPLDTFDNDAAIIHQSILDARDYADETGLVPINTTENQVPTNGTIRTFLFNSDHQGSKPGGFYYNNLTYTHDENSTLLAAVLNNNSREINMQPGGYIYEGDIVDVIMNNINFALHPHHLHGHQAWLLASGRSNSGFYNESTRGQIVYNTENAILRDTFTVNPNSYFVLRFKANNFGVWMFHCHNDWHVQLGMSMVFIESPEKIRQFYANNPSITQVQSSCSHH